MRIRYFFVLIMFVVLAPALCAQSGKVTGVVTDATTEEPLPFVNVIIMGTTMGAATNLEGEYVILNVPPGTYAVKASAIGYNSLTVENIQVATGLTSTIDFPLGSTSIELDEDVVVVAEKPLIRKDLTASTNIVGDELISELPVTEIGDVLQLQAGVTVGSGGEIHMRGGRSNQIVYQIDGVPVTDVYDNSTVVDVNTGSVKELQVISGAFNAEYGQAMSGIINIVTKDGSNDFTGKISAYTGDYLSQNEDIFRNIDDFNPIGIYNTELSLSGPVIPDKVFFFANGRFYNSNGYFFGEQVYLPTDIAREDDNPNAEQAYFFTDATDPSLTQKEPGGSGEFIAMNPNRRIFLQGKLTYKMFTAFTIRYSYMWEYQNYKDYSNSYRLTPDNNLNRFRRGNSNTFSINHAVSNRSFYTLNLSYFYKDYRHYLYKDLYTGDPARPTLYIDNQLKQNPPFSLEVGGTDYNRFVRNTGTFSAKLDWETQFTKEINVKWGGEFKEHQIFYENITLIPMLDEAGQRVFPFNVAIPPLTSTDHDMYDREPREAAAYVQAKFEAFNLIFNAGVRFDFFDPNHVILADPTDPNILNPLKPSNRFNDTNGNGEYDPGETIKTVADREAYWYEDASVKTQLSPRLGIAFPITDRGVIHFSYGHFFQLPPYEYLYTNPDFELGVGSGNQGLFGNADLEPQKTVKGEIGLQQQIADDMAIDVTVFFEDFRNLTGTQTESILVFGGDRSYSRYSNSDFGFAKGFILKFEKRFGGGLAVNADYTFSVVKGNASNPQDARNAVLGGALPETFIAPLDWDQTHTLNLTVAYSKPGDYGLSLIANLFSGQPYTPQVNKNTRVTQNAFPRNSGYKPEIFNIDMRAYKDFQIGGYRISLFLRVFNLLDSRNPRNIFGDTGDPFFTFGILDARNTDPELYNNSIEDYYLDPGFFSEPRRVEIGASFNF